MTPFGRNYLLYMLATLMATCCVGGIHPSEDDIIDGRRQRTPRQLNPGNQFQSDSSASGAPCGGKLTAQHGVIQTPDFPNKFPVPITCVWVIDASELATGINVSIVIYPTQLYVLSGLKFTEYMYYGDDFKVRSQRVFQFSEHNVTKVAWIQFHSQYLEISFSMKSLDGTHLRALDHLLDVYGFNITYEVGTLKPYQCNALKCRFLGHCYATLNFTSYYCSCFPGYSGSDCGQGPLCDDPQQNVCENGGTCKQLGASAVTCLCKDGYKGNKCEIPEATENLGCFVDSSKECQEQCLSRQKSFRSKKVCRCNSSKNFPPTITSYRNGKWRYQMTMRLSSNISALLRGPSDSEKHGKDHLKNMLERHISRVLRNMTSVSDLELINNMSETNDISFHLYAHKIDSSRIHESISRMIERGRLGNYTLVQNFLIFTELPPFELQSVISNQPNPIREDSEFILSCVARGSPEMTFRWYKDGFSVNVSLATRDIWTMVLPPEHKNVYTSLLGIRSANKNDDGIYTCSVTDWGDHKCRSIVTHIKSPPELRIEPPSVTVYRGDSLTIRCLSPESDHLRYGQLGYSWTRNGILFQSNPTNITWEDLYPDGSILRIRSIQKSAEFSCIVSNSVAPVSKSVHVMVVDKGSIELCPSETSFHVKWPPSAPGPPIVTNCQKNYQGLATRTCEQHDVGKANWLTPNFSNCVSNEIVELYKEFQKLLSGYQVTNCLNILEACLEYTIRSHLKFYPGEGSFLLDLLEEVEKYLRVKGTHHEKDIASEMMLHILDKIIQNPHALNNLQQVKMFQHLTQNAAYNYETVSASQLATPISESSLVSVVPASSSSSSSSTSLLSRNRNMLPADENSVVSPVTMPVDQIGSFRIFKSSVKSVPFNMQVHSQEAFSDILNVQIDASSYMLNILLNSSVHASVIAYKNLANFLPKRYFARSGDGSDIDYIPASRIITSHLLRSNNSNESFPQLMNLPLDIGHIEIFFQHEIKLIDTDWIPTCGHDLKSPDDAGWQTDTCITKHFMENITRCICPLSGTFVVLFARKNNNSSASRASSRSIFVVVSCCCCFVQSCAAFVILIPILYNRKCCITFLKMQFCTSTSTVMAIFILGFLKLLPQDWHGIISSTLASLMLLALSSLVAIALVVQSDLLPKKAQMANLSSGIKGAICVSWLLPILFAICSPLIYTINGRWPLSWWLETQSSGFVLFITVEALFVLLFIMLFGVLVKKLLYLVKKYDKQNLSLWRRIGLLYRTGVLVFLKATTDAFFLILPGQASNGIVSHIFGALCILLGTAILICFVIKAESSLKPGDISKQSPKGVMNDVFCSTPIHHHIGFYSNQEIDNNFDKISVAKLPITTPPTSQANTKNTRKKSLESFINVVNCDSSNRDIEKSSQDVAMYEFEQSSGSTFEQSCSTSRCCNLLGKSSTNSSHIQVEPTVIFDKSSYESKESCIIKDSREIIGVETLDILKGVSQDSIIGIRSCLSQSSTDTSIIVSQSTSGTSQSKIDTSTQTPKTRKRVTIEEPLHTAKSYVSAVKPFEQSLSSPPILTFSLINDVDMETQIKTTPHQQQSDRQTSANCFRSPEGDEDAIDGMLQRISHDLNFLLNGAVEVPTKCEPGCILPSNEAPAPPFPSTSSSMEKPSSHTGPALQKHSSKTIQEVIIEEPDME